MTTFQSLQAMKKSFELAPTVSCWLDKTGYLVLYKENNCWNWEFVFCSNFTADPHFQNNLLELKKRVGWTDSLQTTGFKTLKETKQFVSTLTEGLDSFSFDTLKRQYGVCYSLSGTNFKIRKNSRGWYLQDKLGYVVENDEPLVFKTRAKAEVALFELLNKI